MLWRFLNQDGDSGGGKFDPLAPDVDPEDDQGPELGGEEDATNDRGGEEEPEPDYSREELEKGIAYLQGQIEAKFGKTEAPAQSETPSTEPVPLLNEKDFISDEGKSLVKVVNVLGGKLESALQVIEKLSPNVGHINDISKAMAQRQLAAAKAQEYFNLFGDHVSDEDALTAMARYPNADPVAAIVKAKQDANAAKKEVKRPNPAQSLPAGTEPTSTTKGTSGVDAVRKVREAAAKD